MNSALDAGVNGIRSAQESAARHAERLSRFGREETDIVGPHIGLKLDTVQVKAAAAVLKTDAETRRSLLDILA